MLTCVIYVKGNEASETAVAKTVESLEHHNWNYSLVEGVTAKTIDHDEFPFPDLRGGRLESFRLNSKEVERNKYLTKKSCLFNNLRLARFVIEKNQPAIFMEHDVVVTMGQPNHTGVIDSCFLNMDGAFFAPSALNKSHLREWYQQHYHKLGVQDFPYDYPLRYYKESIYYGSLMTPGTSAYMLTVSGAKKLLKSAEIGLEQSDFIINSHIMNLQYLYPSPVKFQSINPNLSHTLT